MLIGFTITNLNGQNAAAIAFIQQVCMLPDPSTAANIVARVAQGANINIYPVDPSLINESQLAALPFSTQPVFTTPDITVISIVDFPVTMPYVSDATGKQTTLKLLPTMLGDIDYAGFQQIQWFITNKYVRTIPTYPDQAVADFTAQDFSTADFFAE